MGVLHRIAEGGQTWAHRVRMLRQVLKIAMLLSLVMGGVVLSVKVANLPSNVCWGAWYHIKARVVGKFKDTVEVNPQTWREISRSSTRPSNGGIGTGQVAKSTRAHFELFWSELSLYLKDASKVSTYGFCAVIGFFLLRGRLSKKKKYLSGKRIVKPWRIALKLRIRGRASKIRLGALPLVKGAETQHMLVTGGTGSGKTNCFHHLLPQIRKRGQKAVIVDVSGAFVDRYYREGDIILNPFDGRGAPWHPWVECRDQFDYDSMAESLIPQSHRDSELYWRNAARALFSVVLDLTSDLKRISAANRWILREPLTGLCDFVAGTKAASFVDINSEKTAGSVRSVAASFLECLSHLSDTSTPFSIREWVGREGDDSWLFLYTTPGQRAALKPLLGCWFSVAVRSLLQLDPDLSRRLWFIIDELPSLNRIKDLELFLAESRKYGGCATLALQSPAQLEAIYGREGAQMIVGNTATKIVFSERDPEVSERISKAFGVQEIEEYKEGISYGAHEMRDGVSLSKMTRQRPVVSANDIQSLKNNQAYVRLPGDHSVTRLKFSIVGEKS